jgi:hypothetical protein
MKASLTQPALVGGLVIGVLSALPIIQAGNACCCLWIVAGGVVAAYVLQQNQAAMITPGDGALAGLLAGVVGAFVDLILSIPLTFLIAPMQRALLARLVENGGMPPEFREFVTSRIGAGIGIVVNFVLMLVVGVAFATIGGVLGAVIFRKQVPPPPPPPSDISA